MLSIAGVQVLTTPCDVEANLRRAEALIRAAKGHKLFVLPELSSTGYGDEVFARRDELAEEVEDESGRCRSFFGALAADVGAYIAYGFLRRRREDGAYCISHAVVAPDGCDDNRGSRLVAVYDKMHLCDMGACSELAQGISRGAAEPCVFELRGANPAQSCRVGLCICYDIRFPELWRRMCWGERCVDSGGVDNVVGDADVVLHPSAFIRDATFPTWHSFVTTRAVENQVYVLSVSHAGESFGDSIACPPWFGPIERTRVEPGGASKVTTVELGPEVLRGCEEGVVVLRVDTETLQTVRAQFPYRQDARLWAAERHT